ncbi:MAG: methionine ABC transporter permease, partial [Megasphaera micronuciformis]|nr:methionine ABC transporter permease [Megasphaera micronuciformis]
QRFRTDVMLATIVILIIGVNAIQAFGDFLSRKTNKR